MSLRLSRQLSDVCGEEILHDAVRRKRGSQDGDDDEEEGDGGEGGDGDGRGLLEGAGGLAWNEGRI